MPQMPLGSLSLYIFFTIMLLMFCFVNYYSYVPSPSTSSKKVNNIMTMNWKW